MMIALWVVGGVLVLFALRLLILWLRARSTRS